MIIDIHAHAFPDPIAERAVRFLEEEADIKAFLDGKVSSLLASMDLAGVDISVVASISTKPSQFGSILEWSTAISSQRILPFPSVHPDNPAVGDQVKEIARSGFLGLKLHPYYQNFTIDEPRLDAVYEQAQREGLAVLMHTGFDMAYPRDRMADPERVIAVLRRFPDLKLIASHFGAWEDWDKVEEHLIGRRVYIDTSCSITQLGRERARSMLERHDHRYVLFGSDSPWGDQSQDLETLRGLGLDDIYLHRILGGNAAELLNLT